MKKKIFAILLSAVMLCSIATACNQSTEETSSSGIGVPISSTASSDANNSGSTDSTASSGETNDDNNDGSNDSSSDSDSEFTTFSGPEGIPNMLNEFQQIKTGSQELLFESPDCTSDVSMFAYSLTIHDMMLMPLFNYQPAEEGENHWVAQLTDYNGTIEINYENGLYNFFASAENYDEESEYTHNFFKGYFDEESQIISVDIYDSKTENFSDALLSAKFECQNNKIGYLSQYALLDEPGADNGVYIKGVFNTYGCYMSESWLSDAVFTSISETNITNPKRFCTKQFDYVYYENGELEYNFNM